MIHTLKVNTQHICNCIRDAVRKDKRGQTTTEYVAVTAIGVGIAAAVAFTSLVSVLNDVVEEIISVLEGLL